MCVCVYGCNVYVREREYVCVCVRIFVYGYVHECVYVFLDSWSITASSVFHSVTDYFSRFLATVSNPLSPSPPSVCVCVCSSLDFLPRDRTQLRRWQCVPRAHSQCTLCCANACISACQCIAL
jgi:hypothetical protein